MTASVSTALSDGACVVSYSVSVCVCVCVYVCVYFVASNLVFMVPPQYIPLPPSLFFPTPPLSSRTLQSYLENSSCCWTSDYDADTAY